VVPLNRDYFDIVLFGGFQDECVSPTTIRRGILLDDKVGDVPSLPEFGKKLGGFTSNNQKLRVGLSGGDVLGENVHRLEEEPEAVDSDSVFVDIIGIPAPDREESGGLEVQSSMESRGIVEPQVGAKPIQHSSRF